MVLVVHMRFEPGGGWLLLNDGRGIRSGKEFNGLGKAIL